MLTRRHFLKVSSALVSAPLVGPAFAASDLQSQWDAWDAQVTPPGYVAATTNP
jgi:hypothetical protein